MYRRFANDKLDPAELIDADQRKSIFREMSRHFVRGVRDKDFTDAPGAMAKIMEAAFRAGYETAKSHQKFDVRQRVIRSMTEMDLTRLSRESLPLFRHSLFGAFALNEPRKELRPEGLALFMRPKVPGFHSSISKDEWLIATRGGQKAFGNTTVNPMIKQGLIRVADETPSGWRIAHFTEWGLEMLLTGKTSFPEDRAVRGSSTHQVYDDLANAAPLMKAGSQLGFLSES